MRTAIRLFIACILLTTVARTNSEAQGTLIHYWNFNTLTGTMYTPTINAIPADFTDISGSNARILYAEKPGTSSAYSSFIESFTSSPTDYDTVNVRMSAPSGTYIRTRNPSDSMELLFYTPSTHFKNLVFTFGTSRPVNGMIHQNYDYSIDSGTSWTTTGLSMLTDSVWSTFQRVTLTTTNAAVNNNSKLVFRVTWTGNNTGTSGNNRFDNVSLDGDSITTTGIVNEFAPASASYALYPDPVINELHIIGQSIGTKLITITNLTGQEVYRSTEAGKQITLNTTGLKSGYYVVRITDSVSGEEQTMKFIKL